MVNHRPAQTELMKSVCKRAQLLRTFYKQSSWTEPTNEIIKKKPSSNNKKEKQFQSVKHIQIVKDRKKRNINSKGISHSQIYH